MRIVFVLVAFVIPVFGIGELKLKNNETNQDKLAKLVVLITTVHASD